MYAYKHTTFRCIVMLYMRYRERQAQLQVFIHSHMCTYKHAYITNVHTYKHAYINIPASILLLLPPPSPAICICCVPPSPAICICCVPAYLHTQTKMCIHTHTHTHTHKFAYINIPVGTPFLLLLLSPAIWTCFVQYVPFQNQPSTTEMARCTEFVT